MNVEVTIPRDVLREKLAIKDGRDGIDGKDGKKGAQGEKGDKGDQGDVTDLSADLQIIRDEQERVRKSLSRVQTPAKAFMIHRADCSSQCDGNTKSFNVGGTHFGIVGVFSTEAPLIYRPIIDYTETKSGFQLTSAVNAPASGQTLVAQFLK